MSEITINGPDGSFSAYLATPDGGKGPGVLVIQEIFGVNKNLRELCDQLAAEGYIALCPDLFWRQEPGIILDPDIEGDWDRAFELYQGFNEAKGVEDLITALDFLRGHEGCTGKVGTIGFCLGGKLAYLMATRSNADCNVGYYGVGIETALSEAGAISKPLMLHIAEEDGFVPKEAQAEVKQALEPITEVTIHSYPGEDHAFSRLNSKHYNEKAAKQARERTMAFFAEHLA